MAIGPAILISGVGLLLLTLTNRLGRAVDRSRQLGRELREASQEQKASLASQVQIIYRRARLIQLSIIMGGSSVLLASVLIFVLFLTALLKLEVALAITVLFACCLICLIISVATFIRDIQLSLKALKLELGLPEQN